MARKSNASSAGRTPAASAKGKAGAGKRSASKGTSAKKGREQHPAEDDEINTSAWGNSKSEFYNADEDADKEEEEEALELQKQRAEKLAEADFIDERIQKLVQESETSASRSAAVADEDDETEVEKISRDVSHLSAEERRQIVMQDSPELLTLLKDFKEKSAEVKNVISPVLEKVKQGLLPTSKGVSFLEVKFHVLLSYLTNVSFYMLLKASGQKIQDHSVVDQLVKLRVVMEKMKPIENKLRYQIEKLVRVAATGQLTQDNQDSLQFKPNPVNLVSKDEEKVEDDEDDGVYKAPKIAPLRFEEKLSTEAKKNRELERERSRAAKSRVLRDLVEELDDKPEEIREHDPEGLDALEERRRYEEENFTRLTTSKKDKNSARLRSAASISNEFEGLDDFGDLTKEDEDAGPSKSLKRYIDSIEQSISKRSKVSKHGDDDLPYDAPKKRARQSRRSDDDDNEDDGFGAGADDFGPAQDDTPIVEDEFYESVRKSKQDRKEARKQPLKVDYTPADTLEEGRKRGASWKIIKNKGLTPHRPKEQRNPRIKQKKRFEKASKKLGSVQARVSKQEKPYSGEATGIKKNLAKSVRF